MSWIQGMPSLLQVHEHAESYPFVDSSGNRQGAVWLVMHDDSPFGPYPSLIRLRPAKMGDSYITIVKEDGTGRTQRVHLLPGTVLLQNGFSFWQPLEACNWAVNCRYRPCTPEGLPIDYVATTGLI